MKKLIILVCIAGGIYYQFFRAPDVLAVLAQEGEYEGGLQTLTGQGGADFDVRDLVESDQITVVEFYTEACGACKQLRRHYKKFMRSRSDVSIKRVKMPDRWSVSWAKKQFHLDIGATPFIHIYGTKGELLAADRKQGGNGRKTLYAWMNEELRKGR